MMWHIVAPDHKPTMHTRCTHCDSAFRISPEDLAAARGRVRCGNCQRPFDALANLSDDDSLVQPAPPPEEDTGLAADEAQGESEDAGDEATEDADGETTGEEGDEAEDTTEDIDSIPTPGALLDEQLLESAELPDEPGKVEHLVLPDIESDQVPEEPAPDSDQPSLDWDDTWDEMAFDDEHGIPLIEPGSSLAPWFDPASTLTEQQRVALASYDPLTDEQLAQIGDSLMEEDLENGTHAGSPNGESGASPAMAQVQSELAELARLVDGDAQPEEALATPDKDEASLAAKDFDAVLNKPARTASGLLLGTLAVLLTLALGVQAAFHYREALLQHPDFAPLVRQAHELLGDPLPPEWELDRYEVRQMGGVQDPLRPRSLVISISVRNQSIKAQPFPVVRLVLEDRWGEKIAKRDLQPTEYLPADVDPARPMRSGELLRTDIAVLEPEGQAATNFQIDACLQGPDGRLNCANEL